MRLQSKAALETVCPSLVCLSIMHSLQLAALHILKSVMAAFGQHLRDNGASGLGRGCGPSQPIHHQLLTFWSLQLISLRTTLLYPGCDAQTFSCIGHWVSPAPEYKPEPEA